MAFSKTALLAARKAEGLSQEALAEKTGVHVKTVNNWESGIFVPQGKNLRRLAEVLGKEPEDLMSPPHANLREASNAYFPFQKIRLVPVVSWAAAGRAKDFEDLADQIEQTVESSSKDGNAFAVIVEGDSMEPRICAGDLVVFEPNSEPRNGDIVIARLEDGGGVMVKKFRRTGQEGKTIRLESSNEAYPAREFPQSAFRFIYPAIEFKGRLR